MSKYEHKTYYIDKAPQQPKLVSKKTFKGERESILILLLILLQTS